MEVDTGMVREFLGWGGTFWKESCRLGIDLLLCGMLCALQNVLPESMPELPLFPAVAMMGFVGMRRGAWHAFFLAWLCGLLLDCGCWGNLGVSSLLFTLEVFAVRLVSPNKGGYLLSCLTAGGLGALVWIGLRLLCFAHGMPMATRLAQIPQLLLCGVILTGLIFAPMIFALLDLLPNGFRGDRCSR